MIKISTRTHVSRSVAFAATRHLPPTSIRHSIVGGCLNGRLNWEVSLTYFVFNACPHPARNLRLHRANLGNNKPIGHAQVQSVGLMAPRRSSETKKQAGQSSKDPATKQRTLNSFFAAKPPASASKQGSQSASKRARESIDLTEEEPAAKRAQRGGVASDSTPQQRSSEAVSSQQDEEASAPAARLDSPAQHAADRADGASAAGPVQAPAEQSSLSAAEKASRHAKAQRKLAQEAVRRGREKGPAQPFTPLEKQVAALKRQHPGIMLLIEVTLR